MQEYRVTGGLPIRGILSATGNKNSALPCVAASLLTDEAVVLRNVPAIEDVRVMLEVLESLGASVERISKSEYKLRASQIKTNVIPTDLSKKIRASILFAGPLLARCGSVVLPPPGGDVIGRRRLDTHFLALSALGAKIKTNGVFKFESKRLSGADIFLDEMSVTATENAIMAACTAKGRTIISNAASEPHVQDLCKMLCAMGAKISGIGSNVLTIDGVDSLHGCDFSIGPDFMEIGSFIGLAAATHGSIVISGVNERDMRPLKVAFQKLGIEWKIEGDKLSVSENQQLCVNTDIGGMIPKIDDAPWPGFPPDLTSIMTVVATQVQGTVLIHEKMFESRMFFVDKLIGMGAKITLCDPHRAVVAGPSALQGSELVSPDVRAGMALLIAAMCAKGESVIRNIYQIERGYESLSERLTALGGKIERISN